MKGNLPRGSGLKKTTYFKRNGRLGTTPGNLPTQKPLCLQCKNQICYHENLTLPTEELPEMRTNFIEASIATHFQDTEKEEPCVLINMVNILRYTARLPWDHSMAHHEPAILDAQTMTKMLETGPGTWVIAYRNRNRACSPMFRVW